MTEWSVVEVVIALVGLFAAVGIPVLKLIRSIDSLGYTCKSLDSKFSVFESDNTNSHKRIWEHNDEQDKELQDHEHRITNIERSKRL